MVEPDLKLRVLDPFQIRGNGLFINRLAISESTRLQNLSNVVHSSLHGGCEGAHVFLQRFCNQELRTLPDFEAPCCRTVVFAQPAS